MLKNMAMAAMDRGYFAMGRILRNGYNLTWILAATVIALLFLSAQGSLTGAMETSDQQTILMLEGTSCVFHPEEIKNALTAVLGVKSIDLDKMPGHALVVHDENVKPDTLLDAIQKAKGIDDQKGSWFCMADLMKTGE